METYHLSRLVVGEDVEETETLIGSFVDLLAEDVLHVENASLVVSYLLGSLVLALLLNSIQQGLDLLDDKETILDNI